MPPSGSSSPAGNSVLSKRGSDALRPEVYEEHDTLLPGQTPISRVPELWMSDGNIVLVCQGQAYRVHKGLLALNSVVFRDMVSNAQPDGDEVYAGCPVVRLSDAAEDIQHLLKAVYLRKYFRKGEAQSLSKIGSLLRITKKYMFDSIRQEVVKHFTLLFPSSMSDYISTTRQSLIPDDYNPFIAAQIAIEHDLSSTIPVAVYECTLLPMPTLFDGHSVGNAPTVYLTPSTQRMCITIRERIKQLVYEVADEFIWPWQTEEAEDPPHPYVDHPECIKAFEAARKSADCLYWADGYNVFMTRLSERLGNQESTVMCEICRLAWKDGEASGRVQLWRDLPGLCGLGDWLSLLKADGTVNRDAAIVATPVWSLEPIEIDTARPHKRQREDAEFLPATGRSFLKVKDIWMNDGNVIFLCEEKAFRVHQGVLTVNSSAFRDLLELSTSVSELSSDGCTVLRLHHAAEDVYHLLQVFYHRDYFIPGSSPLSLLLISRLLQMATEYRVSFVREDAIAHLKILFPSTLEAWRSYSRQLLRAPDNNPMFVIEMAQEFNLPIILPAAYYDCTLLRMADILDGISSPGDGRFELSPSSKRTCLLARERLLRQTYSIADEMIWQWTPNDGCHAVEHCRAIFEDMRETANCRYKDHDYDVFSESAAFGWYGFINEPCEACRKVWKVRDEAGRVKMWKALPNTIMGSEDTDGWAATEILQASADAAFAN